MPNDPYEIDYETLVAFASGDLTEADRARVARRVENDPATYERLEHVRHLDRALGVLARQQPSAGAVHRCREVLIANRPDGTLPEVLTLREVAAHLRLTDEELADVLPDLPAFEVAGHVRVRRDRLMAWIQQRESAYTRQTILTRAGIDLEQGVA